MTTVRTPGGAGPRDSDQALPMPLNRVVILGSPGSGKSTLARQLACRLGLPVVHLDVLFWQPGWTEPDNGEFLAQVAAAHAGDAWISEGNFTHTFHLRLPRADAVIILDRPRWLCLFRAVWRAAFQRVRTDLPLGCPERIDRELVSYIWKYRTFIAGMDAARRKHGPNVPTLHLSSNHAVAAFLRRTEPSRASR